MSAVSRQDLEQRLGELEEEHAALREVAKSVASEREPRAIFRVVAAQAARLAGVGGSAVGRFGTDDTWMVMGAENLRHPDIERYEGTSLSLSGDTAVPTVYRTGRPARVDLRRKTGDTAAIAHAHGATHGLAVPVHVAGRLWGAVAVIAESDEVFAPRLEDRLLAFAELLGMAIANAEALEQLTTRALTDSLTGLLNHRAFQERLGEEVERARRHPTGLSLILLDVDGFKVINDHRGHQAGDGALVAVAKALRDSVRLSDVVARIGGDEFAVIAVEAHGTAAVELAERCRAAVQVTQAELGAELTISAGVCDLDLASGAEELVRLADGALYWAKSQGRDACVAYAPDVVRELSDHERAERLARSQALTAIRALARAVDAKDHSTLQHSERVATLARRLAAECGWPEDRLSRLAEAALIHDVGKIGIPDRVLLKPGRLDAEEFAVVQEHATLGAQIVADAMDPEQVAWVRHHHECYDGRGYPGGLAGEAIPDGARILALADSWDVMTSERSYSAAKAPDVALAECVALAGQQFSPEIVQALARVLERD